MFENRMETHLLRRVVLKALQGGLWHTTPPDRFQRIQELGAILPIPENPNPDGWKTMGGDPYRPYAHTLNGVSLLDFDQFDPETYAAKCPMSDWHTFVPYREKWGSAVWIEINREQVATALISGADVVTRWNSDKAYRHNFMPYIEAVHVGPLPRSAFVRAFIVGKNESEIRALPLCE
jgi:hypothetical protein